jgi:hypothetical protein
MIHMEPTTAVRFRGPNPGILAVIFTLLFNLGLSFVVTFTPNVPHFPGPWEAADTIVTYFQHQSHDVLFCSFFQFCSAIPLGLFTVTIFGRLRFLGIKAVGPYIALFGGIFTCMTIAISSLLGWAMSYQGIADDPAVIRALYYFAFALGGVGYSVPLGLLIAGISVSAGFARLLPKWLVWSGIVIAVFGETSCLNLIFPKLLPLIPLTRFPGFIWLIVTGFRIPTQPLAIRQSLQGSQRSPA